mgnify:FL=1
MRTADGSQTIQLPEWGEQYHSMHGALQESRHVFIRQGLYQFFNRPVDLLEIGFGTGLNALITMVEAPGRKLRIRYTGLEAYPVVEGEWKQLEYAKLFSPEDNVQRYFEALHRAPWDREYPVTSAFTLHKRNIDIRLFESEPAFDLVYFDAFGARVQPELWTAEIFRRMYEAVRPGGCLVTYSAKGSVRRAMQEVGFIVERLPGPPGKREMLRASKAP